ncbi:MAG: hypothetical protein ABSC03_04980 [Verrucomicrobiota bacterium]
MRYKAYQGLKGWYVAVKQGEASYGEPLSDENLTRAAARQMAKIMNFPNTASIIEYKGVIIDDIKDHRN